METSRLTRDDWLAAALKALAESGPDGVKPDRLARTLGVSRGSFYWHFTDVTAFHVAIFERWEQVAVDTPLDRSSVNQDRLTDAALPRLIAIAFTAPSALERAIFRWSTSYPLASAAVARVNARRLALLDAMFARANGDGAASAINAKILYWAYLGRVLLDGEVPDDQTIRQIVDIFGLKHKEQD